MDLLITLTLDDKKYFQAELHQCSDVLNGHGGPAMY